MKLKIELPCDPVILPLGKKSWNQDFKEMPASPCSLQQYSQQPRYGNDSCALADECRKKMWHIRTMEYYLALRKNFCHIWQHERNLEDIMWSELSQSQKDSTSWFHLNSVSKMVKYKDAENRMWLLGWGRGYFWSRSIKFQLWKMNIPEICCVTCAVVNKMALCILI